MKPALIGSALVACAIAGPVTKRFTIQSEDASTVGASDASILTYALVLEVLLNDDLATNSQLTVDSIQHLENAFYRGGLENITQTQFAQAGFDAAFYANLLQVAQDEANHVAFLTAGLTAAGANPPAECVYNFPYTDATSFVALASILEGVGVSGSCRSDHYSKLLADNVNSISRRCSRHSFKGLPDRCRVHFDCGSKALVLPTCFAWGACVSILLRHPA